MPLVQFKLPVSEPINDVFELLSPEAGHTAYGLKATVQLWNGTMQEVQTLTVGKKDHIDTFIEGVAELVTLPQADVRAALFRLLPAVESLLREVESLGDGPKMTQSGELVQLALEADLTLFHHDDQAYGTMPVGEHRETWLLRSRGFRRWLERRFYTEVGVPAGQQAVQDATGVLEGMAIHDGEEHAVAVRLAEHDGRVYLDLCDDAWQVVEITAEGWRLMADPPVKFRRTRGMQPLPVPVAGGSLDLLRPFVNVANDSDWRLMLSWLLAALRPRGPYPVLLLCGEQGSAKSTAARILRSLVDPNTAPLRATPRNEHDLAISANNGWVVGLDNISKVPEWLSDALCRLSTGSGFSARQLFSDTEESLFASSRPVIVNAIEEIISEADLLDRSLMLTLPRITEKTRRSEEQLWREFEAVRPQILGALLDAISLGLKRLPEVHLDAMPRMADFSRWACAVATALGWSPEEFLTAYRSNRHAVRRQSLESSLVAETLQRYMKVKYEWQGSALDLLSMLQGHLPLELRASPSWPKTPRLLSNALRRLVPILRSEGLNVTFSRTGTGARQISVNVIPPSAPTGGPGSRQTPPGEEEKIS
jgi:hypothetical protein